MPGFETTPSLKHTSPKHRYHDGRPVFIMGLPRSGTTWLAKMFDSHPQTYYLHEPDISLRVKDALPEWPVAPYGDAVLEKTHAYCRSLEHVWTPRSTGKGPFFSKGFLSPLDKLRQKVATAAGAAQSPPRADPEKIRLIMKSVSNFSRLGIFAHSSPQTRHIAVVRHPLGQVDSMLRGMKGGRFYDTKITFDWLLRCPDAGGLGLSESVMNKASDAERVAWLWTLSTNAAAKLDADNIRLVYYDNICVDPIGSFKELFEYSELDMPMATKNFLSSTTNTDGSDKYFGVNRVSADEPNKWRYQFSLAEQNRLWDIASRSAILSKLPGIAAP